MSDDNPDTRVHNGPGRPKSWRRPLLIGAVVLLVLAGVLFYPVREMRRVARFTACKSNLKQLGHALHLYHEEYSAFPPAYLVDAAGQPAHSWRVLLLPYLGERELYKEYRF